jgi:putative membrane protein
MGLANLVPGVSGGTMILALGLYDRFITAVAELTRLRPSRTTLRFLAIIGVGLVVAIVGLAGPAVWLVTSHRSIAYSLFIGMALGGVPSLAGFARPFGLRPLLQILVGVAIMAGVAFGMSDSPLPHSWIVFLVIGAVAASSMILPGISGSYILLIFGLYDVVVGSIRPSALREDWRASIAILIPVGIGVVLGIGLLSNVLKLLLHRFERPTHCVLLGLLVGSVLGLWPFQAAAHPHLVTRPGVEAVLLLQEGGTRELVLEETGVELTEAEALELTARHSGASKGDLKLLGLQLTPYPPSLSQVAIALAVLLGGFAITRKIGGEERSD